MTKLERADKRISHLNCSKTYLVVGDTLLNFHNIWIEVAHIINIRKNKCLRVNGERERDIDYDDLFHLFILLKSSTEN